MCSHKYVRYGQCQSQMESGSTRDSACIHMFGFVTANMRWRLSLQFLALPVHPAITISSSLNQGMSYSNLSYITVLGHFPLHALSLDLSTLQSNLKLFYIMHVLQDHTDWSKSDSIKVWIHMQKNLVLAVAKHNTNCKIYLLQLLAIPFQALQNTYTHLLAEEQTNQAEERQALSLFLGGSSLVPQILPHFTACYRVAGSSSAGYVGPE
jgi:hypothetical protein